MNLARSFAFLVLGLAPGFLRAQSFTNFLLAQYRMEEAGGSAVTDRISGLNGVRVNGGSFGVGARRGGALLNGSNAQRVDLPVDNRFNMTPPYTIEFWLKMPPTQMAGYQAVMGKYISANYSGFDLLVTNGNPRFRVLYPPATTFTLGPVTSVNLLTDTWHHMVYIISNTRLSLYVDGAFASSSSGGPIAANPNTTNVVLGARWRGVESAAVVTNMVGGIDEVSFYTNYGLTAAEIQYQYTNSQKPWLTYTPDVPYSNRAYDLSVTATGDPDFASVDRVFFTLDNWLTTNSLAPGETAQLPTRVAGSTAFTRTLRAFAVNGLGTAYENTNQSGAFSFMIVDGAALGSPTNPAAVSSPVLSRRENTPVFLPAQNEKLRLTVTRSQPSSEKLVVEGVPVQGGRRVRLYEGFAVGSRFDIDIDSAVIKNAMASGPWVLEVRGLKIDASETAASVSRQLIFIGR